MTADPRSDLCADAISWHLRLHDGGADDWEAFADWLAVDPARSEAYDAVALADRAIAPALADWTHPATAANDDMPATSSRQWRRGWIAVGAAAAAVVAGFIALPAIMAPRTYQIATAAGEQRMIRLDDGTRIALNGATRITLDRSNDRHAVLDTGEAAFTVTHDASGPRFTVALGDDIVEDVGTMFNIVRGPGGHLIEVAQGSVIYNPGREAVALRAGQTLRDPAGDAPVVVSSRAPAEIAGWRYGRLAYRDTPLAMIAEDLARSVGVLVSVDPAIATRSFSGTIRLDADRQRMFARLGAVLDARITRSGEGWTIGPRDSAAD
jgi:transmembrane sensor